MIADDIRVKQDWGPGGYTFEDVTEGDVYVQRGGDEAPRFHHVDDALRGVRWFYTMDENGTYQVTGMETLEAIHDHP